MFDVDRPTAEYRLSRVLTEHLGECRLSALRGVIAAAADKLATYSRERHAHKNDGGPPPRLSLLTESYESVTEAGRMIRALRVADDDHALERERGIDIATVIDELWQSADLIGRWIEHERTRW